MNRSTLLLALASALSVGLLTAAQPPVVLEPTPAQVEIDHGSSGNEAITLSTAADPRIESSQLNFSPPQKGPNDAYTRIANHETLQAGEHYRLQFEMRAVAREPDGSVGQAGLQITLGARQAEAELKRGRIERQTVAVVADEWESFTIDLQVRRHYAPGEFQLDLRPSFFREQIEVRGLTLTAHGENPPPPVADTGEAYPGHAPDAAWRAAADARIREHRMAPLTITVLDEWGQPLEGAAVAVRMKKHAYLFGTCVKASRLVDAEFKSPRPDFDREQWLAENAIYRKKLQQLFNFAVFENDLKWPVWAGERPFGSQAASMDAMQWLSDHDFTTKGHTLLWGSWRQSPNYLKTAADDPARLNTAINAHIRDQGDAMRDWVQYADVLNEALSHDELIQIVGESEVAHWFQAAKEQMPQVQLVINEFDLLGNGGSARRQDRHEALVRRLLDAGAPIDVLGFQSHFWSTRLTAPERLYSIIERFAAFGLPLMVSEFDMNILDEPLQADYSRDFLKVWFSHPATEAYIMWGFGKAHWFGEAGAMFRNDWSPKPNLKAYTDLVFGEWWTDEDLTSATDGIAEVRAFHGDYEITASAPGRLPAIRRPTLTEDGLHMTLILYPAPE